MRIVPISLPTPYPVGPVNAYLLPGPPVTLVDCGPKTPEAKAGLEEGLARAGTIPAQIERLIITHGHVDHFGLAAAVTAASGAAVLAHEADAPKLAVDRAFIEPMRTFIAQAGFPLDVADMVLASLRRYRGQLDAVVPTTLVRDGDRIPLGDDTLEVLHTPGHAQGHICLWDGEALISGDLLLEEISPNPLVEFARDGTRLRTLPALIRSLVRIEALNPALAYPGHGDPLSHPAARVPELIQHHNERKKRLARNLSERSWSLRELAEAWFPGLDQFNVILGLSEVIGHLDLLEDEGLLAVEPRDGVMHYTLAIPVGRPADGRG
jgi:glyoxylase-like metal-dependent hydrolase (beta-lactamase superfamily II)